MEETDDIFKYFDAIGEKNCDEINYKESLLANLFSQVELLRGELKEKNFIIRNLLNRMKSDNCIILQNHVQRDKKYKHSVETSLLCNLSNSDETEIENLIDLSNDINDQASDKSTDTQMSNKKCSNIPTINDMEISIDNQSILIKGDITITNDETSNGQLIGVCKVQHEEYLKKKSLEENVITNVITNGINKWPTGTILITSDSICNNLDERRLARNSRVKVRCFPGAQINDMYNYLEPLLQKQPDYVILHVSTNDAIMKTF